MGPLSLAVDEFLAGEERDRSALRRPRQPRSSKVLSCRIVADAEYCGSEGAGGRSNASVCSAASVGSLTPGRAGSVASAPSVVVGGGARRARASEPLLAWDPRSAASAPSVASSSAAVAVSECAERTAAPAAAPAPVRYAERPLEPVFRDFVYSPPRTAAASAAASWRASVASAPAGGYELHPSSCAGGSSGSAAAAAGAAAGVAGVAIRGLPGAAGAPAAGVGSCAAGSGWPAASVSAASSAPGRPRSRRRSHDAGAGTVRGGGGRGSRTPSRERVSSWPRSLSAASLSEAAAAAYHAEQQLLDRARRRPVSADGARRFESTASSVRRRSRSSEGLGLARPPLESKWRSLRQWRHSQQRQLEAQTPCNATSRSLVQCSASPAAGALATSVAGTAARLPSAAVIAASPQASTPALSTPAATPVAATPASFIQPPEEPPEEPPRESMVDVFLRIRPAEPREFGESICVRSEGCNAYVEDPACEHGGSHWFAFEGVVDSSDGRSSGQEEVFELVGTQVVASALQGFHTCVFSMGQTGTGKTYTLVGTPEAPGLLPRILEELLAARQPPSPRRRIRLSCLELHMDRLRDLLADDTMASDRPAPEIRSIPNHGVYVSNLYEVSVEEPAAALKLVQVAARQRAVARTGMNATSSRGHAVFQLTLESGARLCIVDLAGRENERTTRCRGQTLAELGYINKSLFHLTSCIQALSRPKSPRNIVPFRNSKLTLLLSECLQSSRASLVATVSPAISSLDETLTTLRLAQAVRQITTHVRRGVAPRNSLVGSARGSVSSSARGSASARGGACSARGSSSARGGRRLSATAADVALSPRFSPRLPSPRPASPRSVSLQRSPAPGLLSAAPLSPRQHGSVPPLPGAKGPCASPTPPPAAGVPMPFLGRPAPAAGFEASIDQAPEVPLSRNRLAAWKSSAASWSSRATTASGPQAQADSDRERSSAAEAWSTTDLEGDEGSQETPLIFDVLEAPKLMPLPGERALLQGTVPLAAFQQPLPTQRSRAGR